MGTEGVAGRQDADACSGGDVLAGGPENATGTVALSGGSSPTGARLALRGGTDARVAAWLGTRAAAASASSSCDKGEGRPPEGVRDAASGGGEAAAASSPGSENDDARVPDEEKDADKGDGGWLRLGSGSGYVNSCCVVASGGGRAGGGADDDAGATGSASVAARRAGEDCVADSGAASVKLAWLALRGAEYVPSCCAGVSGGRWAAGGAGPRELGAAGSTSGCARRAGEEWVAAVHAADDALAWLA